MPRGGGKEREEYLGKPVYAPQEALALDYDAIVVTTRYSEEIYRTCREVGIPLGNVIFTSSNHVMKDLNSDYGLVERVLGKGISNSIRVRDHIIMGVEVPGHLCLEGMEGVSSKDNDYVRYSTFQLAVQEINDAKLAGDVAEAGVFRGDFAQYINYAFPNRTLYLFDSFEGFVPDESINEMQAGNATSAMVEAYKNQSVDTVLKKMTYPEMVDIRQGFIPDTFQGLDDKTYCFVSLDVDFEDSLLAGLRYFYPRLVENGYIFMHDYNSRQLQCAKAAVSRYEEELGRRLAKVPLCDINGTLVITK